MEIIVLVILAGLLGYVNAWLQPKIASVLPVSLTKGKMAQVFLNGGIILVALFVSVILLRAVGLKGRMA